MGRTQHLTRLALGRSALQDVSNSDANPTHDGPAGLSTSTLEAVQPVHDVRHFDLRGRPTNPQAESRKVAMRRAQNAVLALVGLVEDHESNATGSLNLAKCQTPTLDKNQRFQAENASAEDLELLWAALRPYARWWPEMVVQNRFATGIYASSLPFSRVALDALSASRERGFNGFMESFLPGVPSFAVAAVARLALYVAIQLLTGQIQEVVIAKQGISRKAAQNMCYGVELLERGLFLAVDILLLPLGSYAMAQAGGIIPCRPLLPSWSTCLPFTSSSMHAQLWTSSAAMPIVGNFLSPAALMLFAGMLRENLAVSCSPEQRVSPNPWPLQHFPGLGCFSWLSRRITQIGVMIMRCVDGDSKTEAHQVETISRHENQLTLTSDPENHEKAVFHEQRRSLLATLPIYCLRSALETRLQYILMLPLTNLEYRVLAWSFMHSSLGRANDALKGAVQIYRPFGGGPLGCVLTEFWSLNRWQALASYANKLGLCVALQTCVDFGSFFAINAICRWTGARWYGWRRLHH